MEESLDLQLIGNLSVTQLIKHTLNKNELSYDEVEMSRLNSVRNRLKNFASEGRHNKLKRIKLANGKNAYSVFNMLKSDWITIIRNYDSDLPQKIEESNSLNLSLTSLKVPVCIACFFFINFLLELLLLIHSSFGQIKIQKYKKL